MNSNLEEMSRQIDEPNKPKVNPFVITIDRSAMSAGNSSMFLSNRDKEEAKEYSEEMEPQVQGEFEDFDSDLDRWAITGEDQYQLRAKNQSGIAKIGRGGVKFLSEVTLGTLSASALMLDFGMYADIINGTETEFSNTISRSLDEAKEKINEKYGKVYVRKENEGFKPFTADFWGNNLDTVGTTLTLMIPSMAATRAISFGGKLIGAAKLARSLRISKKAQTVGAGLSSAIFSRMTENTMEAAETAQSVRDRLISENEKYAEENPGMPPKYSEEEINKRAGEAGKQTWTLGWGMLIADAFQYTKAFKGFNYARRNTETAVKKLAFKEGLKAVGKFAAFDMGSEGAEEAVQYIISQESQDRVFQKAGLKGESDFLARLSRYVTDDEFKTSVFMGAIGGGVFAGAGRLNSYYKQKREKREQEQFKELYNSHYEAVFGTPESFAQAEMNGLISSALYKAELGRLDEMEADLSTLEDTPNEVLENDGINPEQYRKKIQEAKEILKELETEYNNVKADESIPEDLKQATVYSRMDRKATSNAINELQSQREALLDIFKNIASKKESSTAQDMTDLKKAMLENNTEEVKRLRKEILEKSKVYKNVSDINKGLSDASDPVHETISKNIKILNERVSEAAKFEEDLKTEKGQNKIRNNAKELARKIEELEKQNEDKVKAREEQEAKDLAEEIERVKKNKDEDPDIEVPEGESNEGYVLDETKLNPEQKKYKEERDKAKEEHGEFETTEPDGENVFTTFNKNHHRTWVKGEVVLDGKGNRWVVSRPIKSNSGVWLKALDTQKEDGHGMTIWQVEKKYGKISHQSKKPKFSGWTVNKTKFDFTPKKKEKERAELQRSHERASKGQVVSQGQEFANFKPVRENSKGQPVYEFENGDTSESTVGWYEIDYAEAAKVFEGDESVSIVIDTTEKAPSLLIKKDGKNIGQIMPKGMKEYFKVLMEVVEELGGEVSGTLVGKLASHAGNLGNVPGARYNLREIPKQYLPNGKIYLGSRKKNDPSEQHGVIVFYAEDGSTIEHSVSESQIEKGVFDGHTYMLMKSPSGDIVSIQLNEARLSDIQDTREDGTVAPKSEVLYERLELAAAEIEAQFNAQVDRLVDDGMTWKKAVEKAKSQFGLGKRKESKDKSIVEEAIDTILEGNVRRVRQAPYIDSAGQKQKAPTANYFNVRFNLEEGGKGEPSKINIAVTSAIPETDKRKEAKFKRKTAETREAAIEALGSRFMQMSLDIIRGENGKQYVKQAIDSGSVTTDVYPKRPWVNTRLVIEFDENTKQEVLKRLRKPSKSTSRGKKAETDDAARKMNERIEEVQDNVWEVTELFTAENEARNERKYTLKQFWETHFKDSVPLAEFIETFNERVKQAVSEKSEELSESDISKIKKDVLSKYVEDIITNEMGETEETNEEDAETANNDIKTKSKSTREKSKGKSVESPKTKGKEANWNETQIEDIKNKIYDITDFMGTFAKKANEQYKFSEFYEEFIKPLGIDYIDFKTRFEKKLKESRFKDKDSGKAKRTALERVIDDMATETTTKIKPSKMKVKTVNEVIGEIIEASKNIVLNESGSHYVDKRTGKKYERVTTHISKVEGKKKEITPGPELEMSQVLGTAVDEFVRDFFEGNLKDFSSYGYADPLLYAGLLSKLNELKKEFDERGETVIPREVLAYNDAVGVAGTLDLLTYDREGNFRIYDMKTKKGGFTYVDATN